MFYSQSTHGFYSPAVNGDAMPDDVVEIDDQAYRNLMDGQSSGMSISSGVDGRPLLIAPHQPDAQAVLAVKKNKLRAVREDILNRLAGIALAAQLTGDTATTSAYITVRQGLLDITENLPADETIDGVVMYRYAGLVGSCTQQMITAFAQVDA